MIDFACPSCHAVYHVPDAAAGKKSTCRKCGQRLRVPTPPKPTVLGTLLPPEPVSCTGENDAAGVTHKPPPPWLVPVAPPRADAPASPPPVQDTGSGTGTARPRKRLLVLGAVAALPLLAMLFACVWLGFRAVIPPAGAVAEKRSRTRTGEEELVKRFILNNSGDADAVVFLSWGPHLTDKEMQDLLAEAGLDQLVKGEPEWEKWEKMRPASFIRVCYRDPGDEGFFGVPIYRREEKPPPEPVPKGAGVARPPADLRPTRPDLSEPVPTEIGAGVAPPPADLRPTRPDPFDRLFLVGGKIVVPLNDNQRGDGWKEEMRRELAKAFPGVEVKRKRRR
jgi:hypothetical protein